MIGSLSRLARMAIAVASVLSLSVASAGEAQAQTQTPGGTWTPTGSMAVERRGFTATVLNDGKVLVAGGYNDTDGPLASAEIYDPATGVWQPTGSMTHARFFHTATRLPNNQVLVIGGQGQTGPIIYNGRSEQTAELYDPATHTWSQMPYLIGSWAYRHAATFLPGNKILVTGGISASGQPMNTWWIYDAVTGESSTPKLMTAPRYGHQTTDLFGGAILLVPGADLSSNVAELFVTALTIEDRTMTPAASLPSPRHDVSVTRLLDGSVLLTGGEATGAALLYDYVTNTWRPAGVMTTPRYGAAAVELPSGKLLVIGGRSSDDAAYTQLASNELFDPSDGSWTEAAPLLTDQSQTQFSGTAVLLPTTGKVLLVGGRLGGAGLVESDTSRAWLYTEYTPITSIAVTPASVTIEQGGTKPFAATATYSDGHTDDVTTQVTWTSSDESVATIDAAGVATSVSYGTTTIRAASGSISGSTDLTVLPALDGITVTPDSPQIPKGAAQQFTATGHAIDGSTRDVSTRVAWTSSVPTVAAITTGGFATAVSEGTSTISATLGDLHGSTVLSVVPAEVVSIAVTPTSASIPKGTQQAFAATGTFTDGSKKNISSSVEWTSSAPGVATIDTAGVATGAMQGTATITASSGDVSANATLTVGPATVASFVITPSDSTVPKGAFQQLTATWVYTDGTSVDVTGQMLWTSSDNTIASVDYGSGRVGAWAEGTVTITATNFVVSATTQLTVGPPSLTAIALSPDEPQIPKGTTQTFAPTGLYTDGTTVPLASATWLSSDTSVATVDADGLATTVAEGSTTISATVGIITGTTVLTVGPPRLASIKVTPAEVAIAKGTTKALAAVGVYTDGSTADFTASVYWSSANPAIANIDASAVVIAISEGATTVTASYGQTSGTALVTVGAATLTKLTVTPTNPAIPKGTSQALVATGTYTDGAVVDLTSVVTWASSDTGVATIDEAGVALAVAEGTSTISASLGAASGSTDLTVLPAVVASIIVSPANPTIPQGATQSFTATSVYTDGTTHDVTKQASWESSTLPTAQIDQSGLATSYFSGTTTITATFEGVSGNTVLTVGDRVLVSIAVTPANSTVFPGTTGQFWAQGKFSDGRSQDVTSAVTWASSDPSVASITPAGAATAGVPGQTTISATLGDITGGTTLTVAPIALMAIAIMPDNASVYAGGTVYLTAVGIFNNGTTQDLTSLATWTTDDPTIAKAGPGGAVSGVAMGATSVVVTFGGIQGSTLFTVTSPVLLDIVVTPAGAKILLGATQQYTATGEYTDNVSRDLTSQVIWTSTNPSVVTVSSSGLATAAGIGSAGIHAELNGNSWGALVTVTASADTLVALSITPDGATIAPGSMRQFTATGWYGDGHAADLTSSVTWSSSNQQVATVTPLGLVTTVSDGVGDISAKTGAFQTSATVTVGPTSATLTGLSVTPQNGQVTSGSTLQFSATGTYSDSTTRDLTGVAVWTSSDPTVATISPAGLVTGIAGGVVTISANVGGILTGVPLTVLGTVFSSIIVTPGDTTIAIGDSMQFAAIGIDAKGIKQDVTSIATWISDAPGIATVTSGAKGGLATGVGLGQASISATVGKATGAVFLTVVPPAPTLTAIVVTPATADVPAGKTQQFTATGQYSDGSTRDITTAVGWSVQDPTIASVSQSGLFTGLKPGSSAVFATQGNVQGKAQATIVLPPPTLVSIAVTPASVTIAKGMTQQFTATGTYSDGSTQILTPAWTSSNTAVATITSGGLATGVAAGTTTVSATVDGMIGSTVLAVVQNLKKGTPPAPKLTPVLTTAIHNPVHATVTTIATGTAVHDDVVVSGPQVATGSITVSWFTNGKCTGRAAATSAAVPLGPSGEADAVGFQQTPAKAGSYAFRATYSGDANYGAITGACQVLSVR